MKINCATDGCVLTLVEQEPTLTVIDVRHALAEQAEAAGVRSTLAYAVIRTEIAAVVGSNEPLRCSHAFTPEEVFSP